MADEVSLTRNHSQDKQKTTSGLKVVLTSASIKKRDIFGGKIYQGSSDQKGA